jgi:hypothetical protein
MSQPLPRISSGMTSGSVARTDHVRADDGALGFWQAPAEVTRP